VTGAQHEAQETAKLAEQAEHRAPARSTRYVFTGDSVTDAGRLRDPQRLGDGWVREVSRRLAGAGAAADVVNTGVAGNRVADLLARWDVDALALAPDVLTVLVGVNDAWPGGPAATPPGVLARQLDELAARTMERDVRELVVVEPFCVPIGARQRRLADEVAVVGALARDAAARAASAGVAVTFVATAAPFAEAAGRLGASAFTGDGIHPTARGHRLLAELWLEAVRPVTRAAQPRS
jgi:lysophospholipase L1-like esterase